MTPSRIRRFLCLALLWVVAGAGSRTATAAEIPSPPAGMVRVPAGQFRPLFRSPTDPLTTAVDSFYLDAQPVTQRDYLEFVRAHPKWRRSRIKRHLADENYLKHWAADLELGPRAPAQAPVTFISWWAAKAYGHWKGNRLPTTAEWEYAAAASATQPNGQSDPEFIRQLRTWYSTPAPPLLPNVRQNPPNYFGVFDLHGLIWEWVADANPGTAAANSPAGSGPESDRFCGNGSKGATDPGDFPGFLRYGFRSSVKKTDTVHNLGFRTARSVVLESSWESSGR